MKKLLSILLSIFLIISICPLGVLEFTASAATSGSCGDNATWSYNSKTLTISGTGKMTNYSGLLYNSAYSLPVPWQSFNKEIKMLVINDGVTSIGGGAFYGCTELKNITIPNSVTSIGDYAFYGCTGLTSVTIPDSVTEIGISAFYNTAWYNNQPDGLVYAGKVVYRYKGECPTSVTIKEGTLGIAGSAFENCTGLTSITIPDSITQIGNGAFSGCTELKNITIPNSVMSIGHSAFKNCTGLTSITIPDSVTQIGDGAFSGCTELKNITIPNSVMSIGRYTFYNCTGLKTVYYRGNQAQWNSISISSYNSPLENANLIFHPEHDFYTVLHEPTSTKRGYTEHICSVCGYNYMDEYTFPQLPDGEDNVFLIEGDTLFIYGTGDIANYKTQASVPWYENRDGINNVIIEKGITKIGSYAFYCLNNLNCLVINDKDVSFAKYSLNYSNGELRVFAENGGSIESFCNENDITYIDPHPMPILVSVTADTVEVKEAGGFEYTADGEKWQSSGILTALSPGTEYNICARHIETKAYFTGIPYKYLTAKTDKATVSAPAEPDYQANTDNSITLAPNELYEYSIDGENWQKSSEFTGLSKNVIYRFYQRVAETETEYASEPSAALVIAIPDKPVILEAGYENILLKKIDGFEYCLDDMVWQESNSFDMLIDNTEYLVYQRLKAIDGEKVYGITSEYTAVTTDNGIAHTHTVIDWLTEESPTCTKKGIESGICADCGKTITKDIEALGHTGGTATCHSKAVCERCHTEYGEYGPDNHDGETEVRGAVAATCTAAGYTGDTYCLGCGAKIATGEDIAALGHSFTNYVSDGNATCTADGTKTAKCDRCDATDTVADVDSKLGHDYKASVTDPTCTEQGYTTHTCSRCQDSYVDTYLDALGHKVAEWECGDSTHWHICTTCGEKLDEAEHSAGDWIIDREASMQMAGEKHKECTICSKILETETIPKLYTPGDINGDGSVNNKDLTRLFQYLSDWDVEVNVDTLDVNGDGKVNNKDLTRLFQYLSDWDVEIF